MWGQTNSNSVLDKANGKVCKLPKPTDEEHVKCGTEQNQWYSCAIGNGSTPTGHMLN